MTVTKTVLFKERIFMAIFGQTMSGRTIHSFTQALQMSEGRTVVVIAPTGTNEHICEEIFKETYQHWVPNKPNYKFLYIDSDTFIEDLKFILRDPSNYIVSFLQDECYFYVLPGTEPAPMWAIKDKTKAAVGVFQIMDLLANSCVDVVMSMCPTIGGERPGRPTEPIQIGAANKSLHNYLPFGTLFYLSEKTPGNRSFKDTHKLTYICKRYPFNI